MTANTNTPTRLDAASYRDVLEELATHGQVFGKTKNVAAYHLPGLRIVTENRTGPETRREIKSEDVHAILDLDFYPTSSSRRKAFTKMATAWAARVTGDRDPNLADFSGPGIWLVKASSFKEDYLPTDARHIYKPNPLSTRVILPVMSDTVIPTPWGDDFFVGAGGHLAIRERELPALIATLDKKDTTALFQSDGVKTAHDVYGMMPYFLENNYAQVQALSETMKLQIAHGAKPQAPAPVAKKPARAVGGLKDGPG